MFLPPQIHMLKTNPQCKDIGRLLGNEGRTLKSEFNALKKAIQTPLSLFCYVRTLGIGPHQTLNLLLP